MKRTVMATALVTAFVAPATADAPAVAGGPAAAGGPAVASSAGAGPPASAERAGMVKVIVLLRSQVDPGTVVAPSRRQRQLALVSGLRARAAADQSGLLGVLARRRAQGLVAEVVPLWVVNAVAVVAQPSVVAELAARPEVREIAPDRTVQAPPATLASATAAAPMEPNVDAVNAPALWSLGLTGEGTVVAKMDTGVDGSHPELAATWRGGSNSWYDPNGEHPSIPSERPWNGDDGRDRRRFGGR